MPLNVDKCEGGPCVSLQSFFDEQFATKGPLKWRCNQLEGVLIIPTPYNIFIWYKVWQQQFTCLVPLRFSHPFQSG